MPVPIPSQTLHYNNGAVFNNGINIISLPKFTVSNNKFDTGIAGGIKLGYFFKSCPYLGLEGESNVGPNNVNRQTRQVSPAVFGIPHVTMPSTTLLNWTTALHIVARYGFLKNSEVPFGRLQPYVGIGPAVVAMYDPNDSAKNFALDVMGGLRFMLNKNLSAFVEYKYNHQFSPELEIHQVQVGNFSGLGTATFAYDLHRVVFGLTYHW
jgi:opacity protein-like surface antigen